MQIEPADFEAVDFLTLITDYLSFASQDACTHALDVAELQKTDVKMSCYLNFLRAWSYSAPGGLWWSKYLMTMDKISRGIQ